MPPQRKAVPAPGKPQRIHRSRPGSKFAQIPNAALQDERLSYQARGILAEILSRPDSWAATVNATWHLARSQRSKPGEGRESIYAAFAELEAAGYLRRVRFRGPRGQFATEVHFCDRPGLLDEIFPQAAPVTGLPGTGPPETGRPASRPAGDPFTGIPPAGDRLTGIPAAGKSSPRLTTKTEYKDRPHKNSLSRAAAAIRQQVPGVTEREIDEICRYLEQDPGVAHAGPYLMKAVTSGDAATLVAGARSRLRRNGRSERPAWCGSCDERTRMTGDDKPQRCPHCHPLTHQAAAGDRP